LMWVGLAIFMVGLLVITPSRRPRWLRASVITVGSVVICVGLVGAAIPWYSPAIAARYTADVIHVANARHTPSSPVATRAFISNAIAAVAARQTQPMKLGRRRHTVVPYQYTLLVRGDTAHTCLIYHPVMASWSWTSGSCRLSG
jgi:hypothetical protein